MATTSEVPGFTMVTEAEHGFRASIAGVMVRLFICDSMKSYADKEPLVSLE